MKKERLLAPVARLMLPDVVATPTPDFGEILAATGFRRSTMDEINSEIPGLADKFREVCYNGNMSGIENWVMGQLHRKAIGTLRLSEVRKAVSGVLEVI
jgi:glutamyl-tRNA(Gln) amidotransferase subunit E